MEGCHTSHGYIADGHSRKSSGPHVSHSFKAVVTMKVNCRAFYWICIEFFFYNLVEF